MQTVLPPRIRELAALAAVLVVALLSLAGGSSAQAAGGTAMGWGYNASGQVGNGAIDEAGCYCVATPSPLLGVTNLTELAAGYEFGLALRSDGSVMSWGYNSSGELGNGNTQTDPVPKPVEGIANAIGVAAGSSHALVLLANGTVLAWGGNYRGELGLGVTSGPETCGMSTACSKRPAPIPGLSGVVAISASEGHSVALLQDGTVVAWGSDEYGQSGNGQASGNPCKCTPVPTAVPGVSGVVAVAAGDYFNAALLRDGTVRSWGLNSRGQLGTGAPSPPGGCQCLAATSPAGVADVRQLNGGGSQTLALLQNGTAVGWGKNYYGEVGNGTASTNECECLPGATPIVGLAGPRKLDGGNDHSTALLTNGTLMTWGNSSYGQIGNGSLEQKNPLPASVPGVAGASDAIATDYNTYAIVGPSQALSIAFAGDEAGTVGGSGILCSAQCSQPFAQGQVKALRADPSSPGRFAGFTGAGCSGTGACFARLDSDQTVTATFGKPKGTKITKLKVSGKRKKKAKVRFTAPGAVTGFQCLLVKPKAKKRKAGAKKSAKKKKPKFAKCASGKTYKKLKPGKYTFKVRALNILGADAKPAKRVFKVRAAKKR